MLICFYWNWKYLEKELVVHQLSNYVVSYNLLDSSGTGNWETTWAYEQGVNLVNLDVKLKWSWWWQMRDKQGRKKNCLGVQYGRIWALSSFLHARIKVGGSHKIWIILYNLYQNFFIYPNTYIYYWYILVKIYIFDYLHLIFYCLSLLVCFISAQWFKIIFSPSFPPFPSVISPEKSCCFNCWAIKESEINTALWCFRCAFCQRGLWN